ncbi:anhydro-N-acetylmuramic acid kinase [Vibrio crassostreae]|uniref:anhydro-N-acetylmuramic acid kinase n=1 Tax=Vibrio crassostreae TaxID=246167 RepID=UPI00148D44E8|nr:anhydro-N-acetylmuramic acid kinase [Vibrio crassostreae]NOH74379.1 anhydro-N-acetylmuramic acid kinase [Vibrio crassostreae]NOI52149.1 anhydro-N-acetylmuramic acid kinase [Vibrio crassostreae]CAK2472201.1 anhydro-N-acetylmuramic acid kinase [Vibrio crassostreae]CAK2856211.1 anhydro-N-acetylmuramic acid kinase [Vibrio crassostreae]CAK3445916.1 anhydro-N-acetylmuramic acid kinase [Vibrio crassostreae]
MQCKSVELNHKELYIGVMSGTSMDGVDTALVSIEGTRITLLAHDEFPMPDDLKARLLEVCIGQKTDLIAMGELDHQLGHLFADAVLQLLEKSGTPASSVTAIGNHGQTVFHQPTGESPFTMQLGDANIIAAKTEIQTVADFRRKDMALGGQGAPLVPAFHHTIFHPKDSSVVVLNIGGISNISVLRPNQPTLGYDTGPGNMLMDAWVDKHTGDKFDRDAQFAKKGQLNHDLLKQLLNESYLSQLPPKSTGRELFNLPWLEQQLTEFKDLAAEDVQRTLCEYTSLTIANEVETYRLGNQPALYVCGGGTRNPLLMKRLAELLPSWEVDSTTSKGVDADYMEAMAFAWLAQRHVHQLPSNLPEVTGASRAASLGVLYRAD